LQSAKVLQLKRAGAYRLARLAVKFGAEILLDDLIVRLSADCPWRDEPRGGCGARFSDLPPHRPPDVPGRRMRLIAGREEVTHVRPIRHHNRT
jgi:hypothetical protein